MSHASNSALRSAFRLGLLLLLLAMAFQAPFAGAQSTGGRVRGTVVDPSGGAVSGANLALINEATNVTANTVSGNNGEYIFLEVPVGTYDIDVAQQGFKRYSRKGIVVNLNEVISLEIPLQVGGASEAVEVTGTPPVVDTTSTQLGAVVNSTSSTQLPLNQRDVYQLLQLQPGVQSQIGNSLFFGSDKAGVVTVNGGRGRSNNYSVNGGDGNDLFANLPAVQPSPDIISEFRVITNSFDAEYGRNSGAVVNVVTKSGTNELHGSAFEFFRNKVLNAKGFYDPVKPDFQQNQFGGTLGGPIKKDKTFIFGSYEGRRIKQGISSNPVPLPTSANLAGDFSNQTPFAGTLTTPTVANVLQTRCGTALSPAANTELANIQAGATPTPNNYGILFPGNQIPTQCFDPLSTALLSYVHPTSDGLFQKAPNETDNGNQFTIKVGHDLSKNQKLSGYYYFDDDNTLDPFAKFQAAGGNLGNFPGDFATRTQQVNVSHTWTLGSTAVNEARFSYFREGQGKFNTPTVTTLVQNSCGSAAAPICFTGTTDTPLVDSTGAPITPNSNFGIHPGLGPTKEGLPFISVSGGFSLGNNFEGQLPQVGNTFQWFDNFSKIIGTHSLKFGGDIRYQKFDQTLFFNVNGSLTFGPGGVNDVAGSDNYPDYLLGLPSSYSQGSAQAGLVRSTSVYLFAQDSWKIRSNVTLNYGLRWEVNTPLTDKGQKVQRFNPGQVSTIYPCQLSSASNLFGPGNTCDNQCVTPTVLVVPGDKGVPGGLINTYYKAFAPRLGLNWSPSASDGMLAKLTGGPNKMTISMGWGLFYNPIEQLVLEQFVAEPPFGISNGVSDPLFGSPFVTQGGATKPNVSDAFLNPPRGQPVDWSLYRPILLFGQFPTTLRTQYSSQYNLTIKRELPGNILFQIGYVGTQGHRLLAIHDQNASNAQTCLDLANLRQGCTPFGEDSQYQFPLPAGSVLHLPYIAGATPGGPNVPCPISRVTTACTVTGGVGGTAINLVGLRPFSSPNCDPVSGIGCPADGTPIFTNIFAEDSVGHSNYNSLQMLLEKRYSHGLQFQASYTYSKSLDNASSFEELVGPTNFNSTYGPSLFDARHRFVFNAVWQLPIRKMEGFAGKALNGWEVSGIYTYQTGFPGLISNFNDTELQGTTLGFECPGRPNFTGPFTTHNPRTDGFVFSQSLFDSCNNVTCPGDPTAVTLGTIGNVPRTLCCNPPINNIDMGIFKDTAINEKMRVEFRTEIFNLFNHAQFYGTDGNSANTTFGQPQKVRDPRLLQFALKLIF